MARLKSMFVGLGLLLAGLSSQSSPARAEVVWTLSNVPLTDGGVLNGSFTIYGLSSDGYGGLIDFHLTTTGGNHALDATYNYPGYPSGEVNGFGGSDKITIFFPNVVPALGAYAAELTLTFAKPLDVPSLFNPIDSLVSFECYNSWSCGTNNPDPSTTRYVGDTPASFASAVPEASTWAMLLMGFMSVGLIAYRRRAAPSAGFRLA